MSWSTIRTCLSIGTNPSYKLSTGARRESVWSASIRPTTFVISRHSADGMNAKLKRNSSAGLRRALIAIVGMTTVGTALPERIMRGHSVSLTVFARHGTLMVYQRNIQFLEDYLRDDRTSVSPAAKNLLIAHVSAHLAFLSKSCLRLQGKSLLR